MSGADKDVAIIDSDGVAQTGQSEPKRQTWTTPSVNRFKLSEAELGSGIVPDGESPS
jgi:hypothetical protein